MNLGSCLNPFITVVLGVVVEASNPSFGMAVCGAVIVLSGALILKNKDARNLYVKQQDEIGAAYSALYPHAFKQR